MAQNIFFRRFTDDITHFFQKKKKKNGGTFHQKIIHFTFSELDLSLHRYLLQKCRGQTTSGFWEEKLPRGMRQTAA